MRISILRVFLFGLLALCFYNSNSQGSFAGPALKKLIGKTYNNDRVLPGLPAYEYREASLASGIEDPEQFTVAVFQKGKTWAVLFGVNTDTTTDNYTIVDVLEIKNVKSNQAIKTLLCRRNNISNIEIVAVVQPDAREYSKALRTWRFNRDKRKFETYSPAGVDCMNEGADQD